VTCEDPAVSDRRELSPRPFDPQLRKVQAACSGLFFEVNSKYTWQSKGVYGSAATHLARQSHELPTLAHEIVVRLTHPNWRTALQLAIE
jgi:hypothetical protein